jgi:hypothetical protein
MTLVPGSRGSDGNHGILFPKHLRNQWDRGQGANQEQSPADGPALVIVQLFGKEQAQSSAQCHPRASHKP